MPRTGCASNAGISFCRKPRVDCGVSFREYPKVPGFETGIYTGGPAGFFVTGGCVLVALGTLLFGKDESRADLVLDEGS